MTSYSSPRIRMRLVLLPFPSGRRILFGLLNARLKEARKPDVFMIHKDHIYKE